MKLFLGVDGGNTKTVALLSTEDGTVVGAGRSGCSDIFNAPSEAAALNELDEAISTALAQAGAASDAIESAVFCLAGADWPEDLAFLHEALAEHRYARRFYVANDTLAGLRAGTADGTGIILAYGTGGAIAARNARGDFWHSGFWAEPLGGGAIGRLALWAVIRAELGLAPPTDLTELLASHFDVKNVEALVKLHNGRNARVFTEIDMSRLAPLVLNAAADGDSAAMAVLDGQASLVAGYARVAANKVGLVMKDSPVVLAGGVFRHESGLMSEMVQQHLAHDSLSITAADGEPATGALMLALEAAGLEMTPTRLDAMERTAPGSDFYRTGN